MAWMTRDQAAAALGITERSVRRRVSAGMLRAEGEGGDRRYWVGPEQAAPTDDDAKRDPVDDAVRDNLDADDSATGWQERAGYVYDGDRDLYVVTLHGHRTPFVRSGEWVRSLWRAYTSGATIAEVCRQYEIDRKTFEALRRSLGLTKTRAPWTDEELGERDAEDLFVDALRIKEREVLSRVERAAWRKTKEDAERWRKLRASVLDLASAFDPPAVVIPRVRVPEDRRGGGVVVVGLTDLHIGKRKAHADHTLADQVEQIAAHAARAIETAASRYGVPDRWVVPVGSDLIHSDTEGQTTTRGTPQGSQSVGSTAAAMRSAAELLCCAVDQLATIAPVDVVYVRGNHDAITGYGVALAMAQRYRAVPRVEVAIDEHPRQWVRVGDEGGALLLWHGDQCAPERLTEWVRTEAPPWVDQRRLIVVHGHPHTERIARIGLPVYGLASPACADDWHEASGYVARPAISLLRHDGRGFTDLSRVG